jgi:hypothetical protein
MLAMAFKKLSALEEDLKEKTVWFNGAVSRRRNAQHTQPH